MAGVSVERLETEVERLRGMVSALDKEYRRIPYLAAFIVAVPIVHAMWGPVYAFYALACVPCLIGTAYYLVGVRRYEAKSEIRDLEAQIDQLRGRVP